MPVVLARFDQTIGRTNRGIIIKFFRSGDNEEPLLIISVLPKKQIALFNSHCSSYAFALCVKTNGTLWAWGKNQYGQLGLNDLVNRSSPVQVGALTSWAIPSCATYYASICTKTDGTLWSWGANSDGRLGLNNTVNRSSPVQIGALTTWVNPSMKRSAASCIQT
jgi:hypothetical protein